MAKEILKSIINMSDGKLILNKWVDIVELFDFQTIRQSKCKIEIFKLLKILKNKNKY